MARRSRGGEDRVMAREKAKLRLADPDLDASEPEQALAALFARQDELRLRLREVDEHLILARGRYAAKHGLLIWPGFDTLRRLFG
jgi:hypothetical protein